MFSSPKIRQSNPTCFLKKTQHETKKPSGSYPIQFNSTHRKCQKNMINCGGPFFPRFCCFPGDAPKLPTFPFHAHLATACCQHCQSPRHGPATFAVLVAGFEMKSGRFDGILFAWENHPIPIGYFFFKSMHQIVIFEWVFFQFQNWYFFTKRFFKMRIFFKLVIFSTYSPLEDSPRKNSPLEKNTSPSFESETIPPLRKLHSWDLSHIPSQLGTFEWMFFQLPFPFGGIC